MQSRIGSEKGSALLIALLLTAMLSLVAIMAVDTSSTDMELSFNVVNGERAFYLAEAGAKRAFVTINDNPGWTAGFANVSFGDGAYGVTITDSAVNPALSDTVIVLSTGNLNDAQASVEMTLVPKKNHPFLKAMFGENSVEIKNSFETDSYNSDSGTYAATQEWLDGDIGSNGTITVHNSATIGGNVSTSLPGGLSINAGATIYGDTTSSAPEDHPAPVPQSEFDWALANNDNSSGISGTFSYNPATKALESSDDVVLGDGVYFFSSVILKNSATLSIAPGAQATVYVTGDIELKNSASMNTAGMPQDLVIYSQGDFVLKNSGDINAVFYSPEGEADLRNSGAFFGAIVAYDIICHNSAKFHYDRNLGKIQRPSNGEMEIVAWREL